MSSSTTASMEVADDLEIVLDNSGPATEVTPESAKARRHLKWVLPALPWSWFILRGLHPNLELVAILLPVLTVSAAFLALLIATYRRSWLITAVAVSLSIFLVVAIGLPRGPLSAAEPSESSRFMAINLARRWFSSNDAGFLIYDQEPDVFVGSELSESHDDELRSRFDFAITDLAGSDPLPLPADGVPEIAGTYKRNDSPSIGVYSNFEIELLSDPIADTVEGGLPGVRALVQLPEGEVVLYALHIPRPGTGSGVYEVRPTQQREIVNAVIDAIEAEELPVVVMGDLNVVDRGDSYNRLTENLWDVMRQDNWAAPTREGDVWHSVLQLRVDHLLISRELCAIDPQAPEVFFTDHRPIQADIGPCE